MKKKNSGLSRRDFIKTSTAAGTVVALAPYEKVYAQLHSAGAFWKRKSGASSSNSLRFRATASAYMNRTMVAPTVQNIWTWSGWCKRGRLTSGANEIFGAGSAGTYNHFGFDTNDKFSFLMNAGTNSVSNEVFRDTSAWYHINVIFNATATGINKLRVYINNRELTWATDGRASLGNGVINTAINHAVGADLGGDYFDGYLSQVCFVDGQALLPSAFGGTDAATGQWVPKTNAQIRTSVGSWGNNGFFLPFNSASSLVALGYDRKTSDTTTSGNNWTTNNISITAGSNYDAMMDSPAVGTSATRPTGNYATLNPLYSGASSILSSANLVVTAPGATHYYVPSTMPFPNSGKWYIEITTLSTAAGAGMQPHVFMLSPNLDQTNAFSIYLNNYGQPGNQNTITNHSGSAVFVETSGITYSQVAGHIIQFAYDADTGKAWVGINNNWVGTTRTAYDGSPSTGVNPTDTYTASTPLWIFAGPFGAGTSAAFNFGQRPFTYTPPTGFKALCASNLPTPAIQMANKYYRTMTYTGNGSGQYIGEYVTRASGYSIGKSLRFDAASSQYISRTPAGVGNQKTYSISTWVKYTGNTWADAFCYQSRPNGASSEYAQFYFIGTIGVQMRDFTWTQHTNLSSSVVNFYDYGKWYHVLFVVDTTQATASDRVKVYIDGIQYALTGSFPSLNYNTEMNYVVQHHFGLNLGNAYQCSYLADTYFIDGQALLPSDFGQTDANSGEWVPKAYGGTYGTNGFYLNFSDNSNTTAATLGKDSSGNNNNFTPNNFTLSGTVVESSADTPTNNHFVIDPTLPGHANMVLSKGDTKITQSVFGWYGRQLSNSLFKERPGKYYWEFKYEGAATAGASAPTIHLGFDTRGLNLNTGSVVGNSATSCYITWNGAIYGPGGATAYAGSGSIATNTIIRFALDSSTGKAWIGINGTWYGVGGAADPATGAYPTGNLNLNLDYVMYAQFNGDTSPAHGTFNFGAKTFAYAAPAGFTALNQVNMSVAPANAFAPDLVWLKSRTPATDHALYDTSRGATFDVMSNWANAETTQANGLQSFSKGGFQIGNLAKLNTAAANYVAWTWKKGVTPGFDVVLDVGTGVAKTVAHSLGVIPAFIIRKSRTTGTGHWYVYHQSKGAANAGILQVTNAFAAQSAWNSAAPTPLLFSVGGNVDENKNGDNYISYLFAEVAGYSKFGSYVGNGVADGPFVWCGFKPAFIMVKATTAISGNWVILDVGRDGPANTIDYGIYGNLTNTETTGSLLVDFLANGFKIRHVSTNMNNSGSDTYIFIAFAESPFKYANAR